MQWGKHQQQELALQYVKKTNQTKKLHKKPNKTQKAEYRAVIVAHSLEKPKAEFAFSAFLSMFQLRG